MLVDIGSADMHAVPIHDGYSIPRAAQRSTVGGTDVTNQLCELLMTDENKTKVGSAADGMVSFPFVISSMHIVV